MSLFIFDSCKVLVKKVVKRPDIIISFTLLRRKENKKNVIEGLCVLREAIKYIDALLFLFKINSANTSFY